MPEQARAESLDLPVMAELYRALKAHPQIQD
jgi:hypothetical protein